MNKKLLVFSVLALFIGQLNAMSWFGKEAPIQQQALDINFIFNDQKYYLGIEMPNAKNIVNALRNINLGKLFSSRTIDRKTYLTFNIRAFNASQEKKLKQIIRKDTQANAGKMQFVKRGFGYGYTSPYESILEILQQCNKYAQQATRQLNLQVQIPQNGTLPVNILAPGDYKDFAKFFLSLNDFLMNLQGEPFSFKVPTFPLPDPNTPVFALWAKENEGHFRRHRKKYIALGATTIFAAIEIGMHLRGQQTMTERAYNKASDRLGEYFAKKNEVLTPEIPVKTAADLVKKMAERSAATTSQKTIPKEITDDWKSRYLIPRKTTTPVTQAEPIPQVPETTVTPSWWGKPPKVKIPKKGSPDVVGIGD